MAQGPGLSASQATATVGPTGAGKLGLEDWLREGLLQLKLGLLWIAYRSWVAHYRDRPEDFPGDLAGRCKVLADRLKSEVIEPSLRVEWLPEIGQHAALYKENPARHKWLLEGLRDDHGEVIDRVLRADHAGGPPSRQRLAELVDAALRGKGPPPPRPGRGSPYVVEGRAAAENWKEQAVALEAWTRIEPELLAVEREYGFGKRLDGLSGEIRTLADRLGDGPRAELKVLADQVGAKLAMYATMIRSNLGRAAGLIPVDPRYWWREAYEKAGESWPPRVLADIAEILHQAGVEPPRGTWLGSFGPIPEAGWGASPRLALALWVLDGLDRVAEKRPLPGWAWADCEAALGRLLRAPATLVRTQPLDPAVSGRWRVEAFDGPPGSSRRLRRSGLILGDVVTRPAEIQAPKDAGTPLAAPLEALRDSRTAGDLAPLAGKLRDLLVRSPDLTVDDLKDPDDSILIWRVLARASLTPTREAALVVAELDRLGYRMVPATPAADGRPVEPGWVAVLPAAGRATPSPLSPGDAPWSEVVALRRPGREELILPTTWLRVPHAWRGRERWLDVLIDREASLLRLVGTPGNGLGPSGLVDLVRGLVAARSSGPSGPPPLPEVGVELAAEVFVAFFRESLRLRDAKAVADRARGEELAKLASDFYRALDPPARKRVGLPLGDDLAPDWEALAGEISSAELAVEWGPRSDGLRIMELIPRTDRSPARVTLTVPKGFDDRALPWVRLPDPGDLLDGRLGPIGRKLAWLPAAGGPNLAAILTEIGSLFRNDAPLNALIAKARRDLEGSPARAWLRQMLVARVVTPWPPLDPSTLEVAGSEGLDACPCLNWDFDEADAGTIVATSPIVFSTDPARARAKVSLGQRGERPWLDATIDFDRSLGILPDRFSGALIPAVDRLVGMARAASQGGPPAEAGAALELAFAAVLRAHEPGLAETSDRVVARLRTLADALGCRVRPSAWSLADPPLAAHVDRSEAVRDADAQARFDPDAPPAGRLVLVRFSVGDAPGLYAVSGGQAPPHYEDLRAALAAAGGMAARLVEPLDAWPASAQEGRLELEAIQFYLKFWEALGTDFRRDSYETFRDAEGTLAALLAERFGLIKFEPRTIQDHPDGWMVLTAQGPLMTGRVARVGRPGLRTKDHKLRVAALVETE